MLKDIKTPNDIKKYDYSKLNELAAELREKIVNTVAQNGGHLSSNLGAVELTIALDYVLDYPKDRIIFDVGHQAYAQKLLTGRSERFDTLRKHGGISGFPSMREDKNDAFTSGHASTSISAALGYCRARDLRGGRETVVAVIGDGALTGGMSYEALNDAGDSGTDLIVVLNDNEMSISRNVGALSMHLTGMRRSHFYRSFKLGTRDIFARIPVIGKPVFRVIEKVRDILKAMVIGENMFDTMGFKYIGPVDGHDIKKLVKAIKIAREAGGPVIIHAVTKKGKGYAPAEKEPDKYHGPGPFDVSTGMAMTAPAHTCGDEAARILADAADKDSCICAVTAAMPTGTGFVRFGARHPKRFYDVGIAEEHAVTMAGGLAAAGLKPYVAIYSTFLQRAYDQILNDVCMNKLPVTFMIDRAGLVGSDGMTHNGVLDLSYLRNIPDMTIAVPRDIRMLRRMVEWSVGYDKPLAIRYPKDAEDMGAGMERDGALVPGKWELLMDGEVMIIAAGSMVQPALMASMALHARGISAGIVDAMFVKPMDRDMLHVIAEKGTLIVTLEENSIAGGMGEGVMHELSCMGYKPDVLLLGVPDSFVAHGSRAQQLKECGLEPEMIADAVERRLRAK